MESDLQEIEWLSTDDPLLENGVILQERHGTDNWRVDNCRAVIELKPTRIGVQITRVRGGRKQLLGRPSRLLTHFELARDFVISRDQATLLRNRHTLAK